MTASIAVLSIDDIDLPTYDHRLDDDHENILALAESIKDLGYIINPPTVRPRGDRYEIVAGTRRLKAARHLQMATVTCSVVDSDDAIYLDAIKAAENLHRTNLSPIEEARIVETMLDTGMPIDQVCRHFSKSRYWVEQRIDLARCPEDLLLSVADSTLPMSHAILLSMVTNDDHRKYLADVSRNGGVTLSVLREWVREWLDSDKEGDAKLPEINYEVTTEGVYDIAIRCDNCKAATAYKLSRLVRVCPGCYEEVHS